MIISVGLEGMKGYKVFVEADVRTEKTEIETPAAIRQRTGQAKDRQRERYGKRFLNGTVPVQSLLASCGMTKQQSDFLKRLCFEEKWSDRMQAKLIRLARTIANLADEASISGAAFQEAVDWKKKASLHNSQEIRGGGVNG